MVPLKDTIFFSLKLFLVFFCKFWAYSNDIWILNLNLGSFELNFIIFIWFVFGKLVNLRLFFSSPKVPFLLVSSRLESMHFFLLLLMKP